MKKQKEQISANMQTIKACSAYNFMFKPIQNVTRNEIERFLQAERHKSNSTISNDIPVFVYAVTIFIIFSMLLIASVDFIAFPSIII